MNSRASAALFASLVSLGLGACSTPGAVFVTKTSLSVIDADPTPPSVSIAFDRVEGFIGPMNADGSVPPVVGRIETDGRIFNSRVKQMYATGDAALAITGAPDATPGKPTSDPLSRQSRAYFGTSTSTGLKIGFSSTGAPNSFLFGYKRKELSVIPNLREVEGVNGKRFVYPPLLAAIDTNADAGAQKSGSRLGVCQYFAAGVAATQAARNERTGRESLGCGGAKVQKLFGDYRESLAAQTDLYAQLMRCYAGVPEAARKPIWEDAARHGLFTTQSEEPGTDLSEANAAELKGLTEDEDAANALADPVERTNAKRKVDQRYAESLLVAHSGQEVDGELVGSETRERLLAIHMEEVCRRTRPQE